MTKQSKANDSRTVGALSTKEIISRRAEQATQERGRDVLVDQSTYNYLDHPGELNLEDSETIPGQSYNIAELVQRFTQGQSLNLSQQTPFYLGSEDFNDIDPTKAPDFDLVDVENLKAQISEAQSLREQQALEEQLAEEQKAIDEANKLAQEQKIEPKVT